MMTADLSSSRTSTVPNPTAPRILVESWITITGLSGLSVGLVNWSAGRVASLEVIQEATLVATLLVLNCLPVVMDSCRRRLDVFDARYAFLAYYFLVFTLPASLHFVGYPTAAPYALLPDGDNETRIKALAAITCGLSGYIIGGHVGFGKVLAGLLPCFQRAPQWRVICTVLFCILLGALAFARLMQSNGGITSFLENLGTWRTLGVLEGVGYLTFPIAVVMPVGAVMAFAYSVSNNPLKRKYGTEWIGLIGCVAALLPVAILGFRGNIVPIVFQGAIVWHYLRSRLRGMQFCILALILALGITALGVLRERSAGSEDGNLWLNGILFRVPGTETTERVIWTMERGEPPRGYRAVLLESATIVMPRAFWPGKPQPASLSFADLFFYDVFLQRGDSLFGIRSGVSPTIVAESLWVGGITATLIVTTALGLLTATLIAWRQRGGKAQVVVYALYTSWLPLFVEAPQNTLNSFVLLTGLVVLLAVGLKARFVRGAHQ